MATTRKRKRSNVINLHLPFVIYLRVSRIGGRSARDGYISKQLQRRECERLAAQHGVKVYGVFIEENLSGTSLERPKFQAALQLVRDGVVGGIIVYTLDRFSRDTSDGLTLLKDIEAHGGSLFCGDGEVTCRTADGEMMATARFMVAAREVGGKREGFAATVENAVAREGRHLGVPYGYRRGSWKGRERVLVAHPDEAPVVERMFTLRKAGHGWNAIAKLLNEDGIQPRAFRRALKDDDGDRTDEWQLIQGQWRGKTVREIVKTRTYLGHAWNGDHEHTNAHQPLVSKKLWQDANSIRTTKPTRNADGYLLTGLVRCASCGYAMVHTARSNPNGGRRRYYVCRSQNAQPCTHPTSVPAPAVEQHVDDAMLAAAKQLRKLRPVQDDSALAAAEAALLDAEAEYEAALDRLDKTTGASKAQRRVVERNHDAKLAQLNDAEHAHDQALQASRSLSLPISIADLAQRYPTMPVVERRHLISLMFACVAVRPAASYGEAIEARAQLVVNGSVPASVGVIAFVAALDWNPTGAGMRAA